ncbi:hypothetical protein MPSEU_000417900 [Mayamaea pseudoterrestris]|nr:hypothetical protein MPSEU_000417900 [Mayamaea pseudoterrestris]
MPAIILFQRRTFLAGDDLQPAALLSVCLRAAQLTLLLIPILHRIHQQRQHDSYNSSNNDAASNSIDDCFIYANQFFQLLFIYAIMSAIVTLAGMLLEYKLAHWSRQGCPTVLEPRTSKVTKLLQLKLVPYSLGLLAAWMIGMVTLVGYAPNYRQCITATFDGNGDDGTDDDDTTTANDNATRWKLWVFAFGMLLATQLLELILTAAYLLHLFQQEIVFDALLDAEQHGGGGSHNDDFLPIHMTNHELVEEMWAERCANACHCLSYASCFLFGGRDLLGQGSSDAFGDVARALADYLETRGVLDLVPSDIIAGLVVLQKLQRQRIRNARLQYVSSRTIGDVAALEHAGPSDENAVLVGDRVLLPLEDSMPPAQQVRSVTPRSIFRRNSQGSVQQLARSVLDPQCAEDMRILEEGARYAKYALAIYTWVLYVYERPITGMAHLAWRGCCACCHDEKRQQQQNPSSRRLFTHQGRIDDDNICQMHKHALLLTAGLQSADLVYAQLRSGFTENPYCILLDHEWRSVVVSIRGTFSLEDVVTDVLIDPEPLDELGREFGFDGKNQYGHGGTLACVRNVYRDLQRHRLLEHLLSGEDASYPDYTLRLVGHSLGAATCTILGFMLRPTFPSLRCVNYGPPGCCLTWEMATSCHDWCSSFILDTDLLSRLNRDSMESLRDEVLELFGLIKVPKIEIVERLLQNASLDDILFDPDHVPDSDYRRRLERFKAIQRERRLSRGSLRDVRLFPPGKIVHLVKTGEQQSFIRGVQKCLTCWTSNVGFEYTPVRVENDDLNEIIVSSTMGTDHFPNRIRDILETMSNTYGLQ